MENAYPRTLDPNDYHSEHPTIAPLADINNNPIQQHRTQSLSRCVHSHVHNLCGPTLYGLLQALSGSSFVHDSQAYHRRRIPLPTREVHVRDINLPSPPSTITSPRRDTTNLTLVSGRPPKLDPVCPSRRILHPNSPSSYAVLHLP